MPERFDVRLVDADDTALVVLTGELDLATTPRVQDVLEPVLGNRRVVLDLRGLTFMDSSGVGLLVSAAERTRLACIAGPPQIQRILEITGADGLLEWVSAPA